MFPSRRSRATRLYFLKRNEHLKLKNRVAFITGGSGSLGREIALALASEGANVGLAARSMDKLEALAEAVKKAGCKAVVCRCDCLKNQDVVNAIRSTVKELGPIDILVNNAAVLSFEPVHLLSDEAWESTIQINLTAPFVAIREVLPAMRQRKHGRIINIASYSGLIGRPHRSAYAASKHGLLGLTKVVAAEEAGLGITANSICPISIANERFYGSLRRYAESAGKRFEEVVEERRKDAPVKRLIEAREIVPLVLYLASDDSAAMTGQSLVI